MVATLEAIRATASRSPRASTPGVASSNAKDFRQLIHASEAANHGPMFTSSRASRAGLEERRRTLEDEVRALSEHDPADSANLQFGETNRGRYRLRDRP